MARNKKKKINKINRRDAKIVHNNKVTNNEMRDFVQLEDCYISQQAKAFCDSHEFSRELWFRAKAFARKYRSYRKHQLLVNLSHVALALT